MMWVFAENGERSNGSLWGLRQTYYNDVSRKEIMTREFLCVLYCIWIGNEMRMQIVDTVEDGDTFCACLHILNVKIFLQ